MMRLVPLSLVASAALAFSIAPAYAATITAADVPAAPTYTTPDGLVTINAFSGGAPANIGTNGGCCFGVEGGTNSVSITDGDGDPATTADQQALTITLDPDAALDSISLIFSRASGPGTIGDGFVVSGFAADPGTSYFSADNPAGTLNNLGAVTELDFTGDTVSADHFWRGGAVTVFAFSNPSASRGQTLTIIATDPDEPGAQITLNSIAYSAVPEPTAGLALLVATGSAAASYRRR